MLSTSKLVHAQKKMEKINGSEKKFVKDSPVFFFYLMENNGMTVSLQTSTSREKVSAGATLMFYVLKAH